MSTQHTQSPLLLAGFLSAHKEGPLRNRGGKRKGRKRNTTAKSISLELYKLI